MAMKGVAVVKRVTAMLTARAHNAPMLPTPTTERTPLHTRAVTYQGYARADGLWDIEGELRDSKHYDHPHSNGTRPAGDAVHHLWLRVTLDERFCIHAIATSMDSTPFGECGVATQHMNRFVGMTIGAGWRRTIDTTVGGLAGCTHIRELLFNLATAAFQTIPHHQEMQRLARGESWHSGSTPPFFVNKCMTWDVNGPVVARLMPQFVGWVKPEKTGPTPPPADNVGND